MHVREKYRQVVIILRISHRGRPGIDALFFHLFIRMRGMIGTDVVNGPVLERSPDLRYSLSIFENKSGRAHLGSLLLQIFPAEMKVFRIDFHSNALPPAFRLPKQVEAPRGMGMHHVKTHPRFPLEHEQAGNRAFPDSLLGIDFRKSYVIRRFSLGEGLCGERIEKRLIERMDHADETRLCDGAKTLKKLSLIVQGEPGIVRVSA